MKYQNILQSFLCHRVNGVNLKMEAVASESLFKKIIINKHWICRINFVFIRRSNNSSWFCRYNTICSCNFNLQTILKGLKYDMQNISKWFKVNSMKPNPNRFQFMVLGKSTRQSIILNINNIKIRESSSVVLLGLTIDNRLTFKDHINILCSRASFKLHALRKIRKYLTADKAKLLYNAFINSQFNYASISCINNVCHKHDYLKIEKIQYKALKIVYNSN